MLPLKTEHFNGREFYFTGIIVDKPKYSNQKIFPPPPMPIGLDGAFGFIRGVITTPWLHNVTSSTGEVSRACIDEYIGVNIFESHKSMK